MMLAQTPLTPPVEIAAFLGCAAFLVMLVNGVMKLVDRLKDKPAPGDVRAEAADRYALKTEFANHIDWNRREHENLFSKIGGVERGGSKHLDEKLEKLTHERREDMRGLHAQINSVDKKVAGLETATTLQNQTLAQQSAKLDRIAERIAKI